MPEKKNTKKTTKKKTQTTKKKTPVKKKSAAPQDVNIMDIFGDEEATKNDPITELLGQEDVKETVSFTSPTTKYTKEEKKMTTCKCDNNYGKKARCCSNKRTNVARSFLGLVLVAAGMLYVLQLFEWLPNAMLPTVFPMELVWALIVLFIGLLLSTGRGWCAQIFSVLLTAGVVAIITLLIFFDDGKVTQSLPATSVEQTTEEAPVPAVEKDDVEEDEDEMTYVNNDDFELRMEDGVASLYDEDGEATGLSITTDIDESTTIPVFVALSEDETQVVFNYWDSTTAEMNIALADISGENSEDLFVANDEEAGTRVVLDSIEWSDETTLQYNTVAFDCDLYCQSLDELMEEKMLVTFDLETQTVVDEEVVSEDEE